MQASEFGFIADNEEAFFIDNEWVEFMFNFKWLIL